MISDEELEKLAMNYAKKRLGNVGTPDEYLVAEDAFFHAYKLGYEKGHEDGYELGRDES